MSIFIESSLFKKSIIQQEPSPNQLKVNNNRLTARTMETLSFLTCITSIKLGLHCHFFIQGGQLNTISLILLAKSATHIFNLIDYKQ